MADEIGKLEDVLWDDAPTHGAAQRNISLDRLVQLARDGAKAKKALRKYGLHTLRCPMNELTAAPTECTCGFDAARSETSEG